MNWVLQFRQVSCAAGASDMCQPGSEEMGAGFWLNCVQRHNGWRDCDHAPSRQTRTTDREELLRPEGSLLRPVAGLLRMRSSTK